MINKIFKYIIVYLVLLTPISLNILLSGVIPIEQSTYHPYVRSYQVIKYKTLQKIPFSYWDIYAVPTQFPAYVLETTVFILVTDVVSFRNGFTILTLYSILALFLFFYIISKNLILSIISIMIIEWNYTFNYHPQILGEILFVLFLYIIIANINRTKTNRVVSKNTASILTLILLPAIILSHPTIRIILIIMLIVNIINYIFLYLSNKINYIYNKYIIISIIAFIVTIIFSVFDPSLKEALQNMRNRFVDPVLFLKEKFAGSVNLLSPSIVLVNYLRLALIVALLAIHLTLFVFLLRKKERQLLFIFITFIAASFIAAYAVIEEAVERFVMLSVLIVPIIYANLRRQGQKVRFTSKRTASALATIAVVAISLISVTAMLGDIQYRNVSYIDLFMINYIVTYKENTSIKVAASAPALWIRYLDGLKFSVNLGKYPYIEKAKLCLDKTVINQSGINYVVLMPYYYNLMSKYAVHCQLSWINDIGDIILNSGKTNSYTIVKVIESYLSTSSTK